MFTMPDSRVFGRVEMQNDLRLAAIALKLPSENIGTHSLRVSCAAWLYQAGYDLEYIKRHGRWAPKPCPPRTTGASQLHTATRNFASCPHHVSDH